MSAETKKPSLVALMWGSSPICVVVLTAVAAPSIIPAEKWKLELSLRDQRNMMIRESLDAGRSVFYTSSGKSMWPLVQSNDACLFHPIQAVTAEDGVHAIQKKASEIGVGDIVFCQVQPSQQYYAHSPLRRGAPGAEVLDREHRAQQKRLVPEAAHLRHPR